MNGAGWGSPRGGEPGSGGRHSGPGDFGPGDFGAADFGAADFGGPSGDYPSTGLPRRGGAADGHGRHAGGADGDYDSGGTRGRPAFSGRDGGPGWDEPPGPGWDAAPAPGMNGGHGNQGWDAPPGPGWDEPPGPGWDAAPAPGMNGGHGNQGWDAPPGPEGWDGGSDGPGPGRSAGRAPWEDDPLPGAGGQGPGGAGFGGPDFGGADFRGADFGGPDPGSAGFGGQDRGRPAPPRQEPGRELDRPRFTAQDYAQPPDRGQREPAAIDRRDRDMAARMDPALQDFFAPAQPRGAGQESRQRPGQAGRAPRGAADQRPLALPRGGQDQYPGRPPGRAPRRPAQDAPSGGGRKRVVILSAAIVVVVVVAAFALLRKSGSGSAAGGGMAPTASTPPKAGSSQAAKGAGKQGGGTGGTTTAYTLSTPATAGGYPQGRDPEFLATATATAKNLSAAVESGHAGTLTGTPVSAAYQLPVGGQVLTFVGYQGTFDPARVMTAVQALGSDQHTYPAGPHGGDLVCLTTPGTQGATAQGSVCVWATTSTLGITEFFSSTGPEILTTHQYKGAQDTVSLRSDVEAVKS